MPWEEEGDEIQQGDLLARIEPFDLDRVPAEVLAVTAVCDIQDDRIESTIVGHGRDGTIFVLGHATIWGPSNDDSTWRDLDQLLQQRWQHPAGGKLKVDAAVIDAGDGGHYDTVMKFCATRLGRKVLAGKGAAGFGRPMIQMSRSKRGKLFIIGVGGIKSQVFARLPRGRTIRFSHSLDAIYFEMLTSERRIVRMARGRPTARFERKIGARAESLDCLVYALAAKAALSLSASAFSQREDDLRSITPALAKPTVIRSQWMERGY